MNKINERILKAIETTRVAVPGYFEKTLAMRSAMSPTCAGSRYHLTVDALETALKQADWVPYEHPAISPDCFGFQAPIEGTMGLVELSMLEADAPVVLDDRKNVGKVSATISSDVRAHCPDCNGPGMYACMGCGGVGFIAAKHVARVVNFTVLILGDEGGQEVVFTFHPGAPVKESQVITTPGRHGSTVTATEAIALGLSTAKLA